jgi:uncharacterized protein
MKVKKRNIWIIGIVVLLVAIYLLFGQNKFGNVYQYKGGTLRYSENRGKVDYKISFKFENESYKVYGVDFESRNFMYEQTRIYGLLFLPKSSSDVPGLVYLPGGGMNKEQRANLLGELASEGYAVLAIDQRGIGQTGGTYLNFEQDYDMFMKGNEPIQHLSVYDGLRAFDVMREIQGVDKDKIAIGGESMGGRYALIAGAIDKRIKGVVVISASGFHVPQSNQPYNSYLISVDPDHYVDKISPRELVMIQTKNDSVVKLEDAQKTFYLAKEPKKFYLIDDPECSHGYCWAMWGDLNDGLKEIFSR